MKKTMIAALVAVSGAVVVNAAPITQVAAQSAADDWSKTSTWSDGNAPASGNTYTMNARVNTPDTATTPQTFAGDSLTMVSGANFQLYARDGATDAVTVNLIMNGGTMRPNKTSTTYSLLQGAISVQGTSTIATYQNTTSSRKLQIDSLVSSTGTPVLNLRGSTGYIDAGDQYIQLNNAGNTFSGVWDIQSTRGIFASSGATGDGSSFFVRSGGYLRINDSWSGDMSISSGAVVDVNAGETYTLDSLTVDGGAFTTLGTYTAAELNTATGTSVFTGAGSIEVIPEPATLGLVAVFGGGVLFIRRRFMI